MAVRRTVQIAGAGIAGLVITTNGFALAFSAASVLIFVPAVLYYVFFNGMEERARQQTGPLATAGAAI